ncbi:MAG: pilus assembly protein [Bdellovibrionaceae bacterium]|nr:pilus assembly protein [Pseudobdellovibrionaceae bacterium]|tara:strand:- start:20573 stop:22045 length:1473 start_codon:yes stop_codon:yes gene_type:complete
MMKTLFTTFLFFALFSTPSLSEAKVVKSVDLLVGVFHDEPVPEVPPAPGKSGNCKSSIVTSQFSPTKKMIRFNPKKPGLCTVIMTDPTTKKVVYEFRVNVLATTLGKVAREIRSLLADIEGIRIKIINNRVVVDGQILLPRDMKRIFSVVKQYGNLASSLVTLSPLAQRKIAQLIERDINNPEVSVRAVNGKFILEGLVDSVNEKDQAFIIAQAYAPDVVIDDAVAENKVKERTSQIVINLINVREKKPEGPKKIIQLVLHYVELKKDYQKGFRFQWTPDIGDGSAVQFSTGERGPAGVVSTITGTITNLLPKLNWAKEHGHARVLQSSSVIVEDTQTGSINSIEKIPYIGTTSDGKTATSFEETGITATITPQVLGARSDSIKLKMAFQVSSLIGMTPTGPLTSSRSIQSVIVVRSGQSAAVGGLISSSRGTDFNKLPSGASTNPLISLYASKTFRDSKSQFVVFVTPVIKSSASAGSNKIKRKFRLKD